jgi:hypothetical protein
MMVREEEPMASRRAEAAAAVVAVAVNAAVQLRARHFEATKGVSQALDPASGPPGTHRAWPRHERESADESRCVLP